MDKFEDLKEKMNKHIAAIFFMVFLVFLLICTAFYQNHLENQISIVDNPTFSGEVAGKESITRNAGMWFLGQHTTHRLHIIGQYIEGDETIYIDRVFTVSAYWYNKFEIGDLIYH